MSGLYIQGSGYEILPNVFVENGTKIYPKCSKKGKMQQIAFNSASMYVNSISNFNNSIELLKKISYVDSELFYPASFGFITSQEGIILDIKGFSESSKSGSVWIPKNGWSFDTTKKSGIVGSNSKEKKYFQFAVEMQFRQTSNSSINLCINEFWSFYTNTKISKFYQIKQWSDGRVRRLQAENVNGSTTLTFDYDNINTMPWSPITPGKENCINPVTTKSGCVV